MLSYQKEGKKIMTEKIDRHEAMCVKIDDFHSDYELCYILVRMLYSSSLSLSSLSRLLGKYTIFATIPRPFFI